MYIPAAPYCPKNAAYAERCGQAFLAGNTPDDFVPEHYEAGWAGRPGPADLRPVGRRQLGPRRDVTNLNDSFSPPARAPLFETHPQQRVIGPL
jgi:Gig2-like